MQDELTRLLRKARDVQTELELELATRRSAFVSSVESGKVRFEAELLAQHRRLRRTLYRYLVESSFLNYVTSPVIYSLVLPLALLDLAITVFQGICFPIYRIPKVKRGDFIALDRHRLAYLNAIERLNCVYCGYANGVIAYVREVASRTEQYWCPIKQARNRRAAHERYYRFLEYGDAQGYVDRLEALREEVRKVGTP